jgi:hypothetical protein
MPHIAEGPRARLDELRDGSRRGSLARDEGGSGFAHARPPPRKILAECDAQGTGLPFAFAPVRLEAREALDFVRGGFDFFDMVGSPRSCFAAG